MAERKKLLEIEYISDHSCGTYQVGEYGYEQLRDFAIIEKRQNNCCNACGC